MKAAPFVFSASDGVAIHVQKWLPEASPVGLVLIAHGMAEHAARYERLATALTSAGYVVYAPDHRGHGQTGLSTSTLGFWAPKGFDRVIEDLHELALKAKADNPGLALYLLGHSMGSFLSQGYISRYGNELAGCILSGSAGPMAPALVVAGKLIADIGCLFKGPKAGAPLANKLSFGSYNDAFKPNRTEFDWLSRDGAEVDKYVADPLCGFLCSYGFFQGLLGGMKFIHKPATLAAIPKTLPVLLASGSVDPVGGAGVLVKDLESRYRGLGIKDVTLKLYEGAHHEIFNETNRDEVTADVLAWLKAHKAVK